jgi:hypothetical protein
VPGREPNCPASAIGQKVFRLQIAPKFFIESENIIVMSSKEKKNAYEGEDPEPPDPGDKGAKFLGWMRKRGSIRPFALCEDYSRSIGLDLEELQKKWVVSTS